MLAGNHALENLIVFTDYNKLQIDGTVAEVNDIAPLGDKWRAFGFSVREIDGHNIRRDMRNDPVGKIAEGQAQDDHFAHDQGQRRKLLRREALIAQYAREPWGF